MIRTQIWFWYFITVATASAIHYECFPYPISSVCRIEYISYHSGDEISFPKGYQQFLIKSSLSLKIERSNISSFDLELYNAMHRPSSIKIRGTGINTLDMPVDLLFGDFSDNRLVLVNTSNGDNFHISYLDLSFNLLDNMEFVSRLVNMETLFLRSNRIKIVPRSALTPLTKLKYLYLQYNYFSAIPWNDIPHSVIHVDCSHGAVSAAEFTDVSLPSLEYLNLQYNRISSINVSKLLLAAPKLQEAHLYNSKFEWPQMIELLDELAMNNVSSTNLFQFCSLDKGYTVVLGRCTAPAWMVYASVGKKVLLWVVAIGAGVLFLYIVLLTVRHMKQLRLM